MRSRTRPWPVLAAAALALTAGLGPAPAGAGYPASGTFMGAVHFVTQCGSGLGVGVAFDGTYLWYTCYASRPDLLRADPATGAVSQTYDIDGGLGAIAYDAVRSAIWAAPGGPNPGAIRLIHLDASRSVTGSAIQFDAGADADTLDDGIAYDATDDTLYFKPDNSSPIHHYRTNGTRLADVPGAVSCNGPLTSGLAIGGDLLFEGKDGCSHVFVVDKRTLAPVFDFATQVAGDPNFRDEGLTCDTRTFAPVDVMWSKEAYAPMRASAFAIPQGACGVGGRPADQQITASGVGLSATEGVPFTATVATFTDPDPAAAATEYAAVIDWGDGSPVTAGTVAGPAGGPFAVAGRHVYAEEGSYRASVTVTDTDTPANAATASSTATVRDAALAAAGACPATAAGRLDGATARFDDAAAPSGTRSDFSAGIDWGDGSPATPGVVSGPDGGPYAAGGSHVYASTGVFTVRTSIRDVGGSTASAVCVVVVYALAPGGGAFVIGDGSAAAGGPVTFWGARWARDNVLSGGAAPASFKGFADSPALPVCGVTWSAETGDSVQAPPAPLPAYMAVIVTSGARQSGPEISGGTVHVVVVRTIPGYEPDPGHPGAGRVVATVC